MADVLTDLLGVLDKQTALMEQISNNSGNSLQEKNVLPNPVASTFKNQPSSTLNSSEKKRTKQVAGIFVTEFFDEQKKRQKDTAEKTKIDSLTQPLGQKPKELNIKDKLPKPEKEGGGLMDTIMDWFMGYLGLTKFKDLLVKGKDLIKKVGGKLKGPLKAVGGFLKKAVVGSFKLVKNFIYQPLVDMGSKLLNHVKGLNLGDKVKQVFDDVVGFFGKHIDDLKGKIGELVDNVIGKVKDLIPKNLASKIPGLGGAAKGAAGEVVEGAGKSTLSKIGGFFSKGAKAVGGGLAKGASVVGGGISKAAGAVKGEAVELAKSSVTKLAKGALKSSGGAFKLISNAAGPLKRIPVLGPLIEGLFTANDIKNMKEKFAKGELSEEDLQQQAGKRVVEGLTAMLGSAGGIAIGNVIGSFVPGIGNFFGTLIGGMAGDALGRFAGGLITDYLLPPSAVKSVGAFVTGTNPPKEEMQDFIFSNGRAYPFNNKDEIIGAKKDGPVDKLLSPIGKSKQEMDREYDKRIRAIMEGKAKITGGQAFIDSDKLSPIPPEGIRTKPVDNIVIGKDATVNVANITLPKLNLDNFIMNPPKEKDNLLRPSKESMDDVADKQGRISEHMKMISSTNAMMIEYLKTIAHNTSIMAQGAGKALNTRVNPPGNPGAALSNSFQRYNTTLTDNRAGYARSAYALD